MAQYGGDYSTGRFTGRNDPGYARFLHRLASFSRLIVFDKRGTGLSDRVTETPTLEERMEDVRAVMAAVGSESAALFGRPWTVRPHLETT